MLYGSKDKMRMENLRDKAHGEWHEEILLAKRMSDLITLPGKAQARGHAAQEVFGVLSPVAYIFFERAQHLGGEDVRPEASLNPIDDVDEAFENIEEYKLPASRRNQVTANLIEISNLRKLCLESMDRINLVNGVGKEFSINDTPMGIIEVWIDENAVKPKLIWTAANEPNNSLGQKRNFDINGKEVCWQFMDYVDTIYISNLVPLYGKSLTLYFYS